MKWTACPPPAPQSCQKPVCWETHTEHPDLSYCPSGRQILSLLHLSRCCCVFTTVRPFFCLVSPTLISTTILISHHCHTPSFPGPLTTTFHSHNTKSHVVFVLSDHNCHVWSLSCPTSALFLPLTSQISGQQQCWLGHAMTLCPGVSPGLISQCGPFSSETCS